MAVTREDQTTFLTIGGVLIACLIALFAIFSSIWQLVYQPVNDILAEISEFTNVRTTNYNFNVPAGSTNTQTENNTETESNNNNTNTTPETNTNTENNTNTATNNTQTQSITNTVIQNLNYNFIVPKKPEIVITTPTTSFPDSILTDAQLLALANNEYVNSGSLQIVIPKISVDSPVYQGFNSEELLNQGFWVSPGSYKLGEGEVVMLCHRRHFGPYDPRTCWFLDEMTRGDEIIVMTNGVELRYNVVGVNVFDAEDPLIYSTSPKEDYIKIVTCTPLYSNEQRLVLLAKRSG